MVAHNQNQLGVSPAGRCQQGLTFTPLDPKMDPEELLASDGFSTYLFNQRCVSRQLFSVEGCQIITC